jgi:hypothetical protein
MRHIPRRFVAHERSQGVHMQLNGLEDGPAFRLLGAVGRRSNCGIIVVTVASAHSSTSESRAVGAQQHFRVESPHSISCHALDLSIDRQLARLCACPQRRRHAGPHGQLFAAANDRHPCTHDHRSLRPRPGARDRRSQHLLSLSRPLAKFQKKSKKTKQKLKQPRTVTTGAHAGSYAQGPEKGPTQ